MSGTTRVNNYGKMLDVTQELLQQTNNFLNFLSDPARNTTAQLQAAAKRLTAAASASGFGVLGFMIAGPAGAIGGAFVGKKLADITVEYGLNKAVEKHPFQQTRIRTGVMLTKLERVENNFVVNSIKESLTKKELAKTFATTGASQVTKSLGVPIPIAPLVEQALDYRSCRLLTMEKRRKIESLLAAIRLNLSSQDHEKIMKIFDDKKTSSIAQYGPMYTKYFISGFDYTKEKLTNQRHVVLRLLDGVVRQMHNPDIYAESERHLVEGELEKFNDRYASTMKDPPGALGLLDPKPSTSR